MADKSRASLRLNPDSLNLSSEDSEAKGNVTVVCRFRPLNRKEIEMNEKPCVDFAADQKTVIVKSQYEGMSALTFNFDRVFNPDSTQNEVYNIAAKPIVESVLEGFNGTVLTYGQTSSGKTHTMTGPDIDDVNQKGIIPRMVTTVFSQIENAEDHFEFTVKVAYCEIYLEKIRDLLFPEKHNLKISEDKARGVYIVDLTEESVSNDSEVYALMKLGHKNREVGATNMNEGSSRSHAIFSLTVLQTNTRDLSSKSGKLYLVDLAGSEKVGKTGAEGKRLDEAKNINKSLSTLGLVIFSLTDGKSTHVPYRDSKLTRVLQDSLGGNSKTSLIITCSPASYNDQETLSTLRFGVRAKAVKNKPKVNKEYSIAELKLLLNQANETILKKDSRLVWLEKHFIELGGTIPSDIEGEELKEDNLASTQEYQEVMGILEGERQKLFEEMEITTQLKQENGAITTKNTSLIKENDTLKIQQMNLLITMREVEEKSQEHAEEAQRYKLKSEAQARQINILEESIKNLEKKIQTQEQEISRIPIDYIHITEQQSLLLEIKELRDRYNSQEAILNANYNKVFEESNDSFKEKFLEQCKGNSLNFEDMANFLQLERQTWTAEHQNLLSDLENKKSVIERLEEDKERLKQEKDIHEKVRVENDQTLKNKVNNLEKNLEQITVSFQMLSTKYLNSKSDLKSRDEKFREAREKYRSLEKSWKKLTEENTMLKIRIEEVENRAESLNYPEGERAPHSKITKKIKGGKGGNNARVMSVLNMVYPDPSKTGNLN